MAMLARSSKPARRLGLLLIPLQQPCRSTACLSSMAADSSPSPSPLSSRFIPGRADVAGTLAYAQRMAPLAGPGHFRNLKIGGTTGHLVVSSLGVGTWYGPMTDEADREYIDAITACFAAGINVVDTSDFYRQARSEVAVGKSVLRAIERGIIKRNEVIISSKASFLHVDFRDNVPRDTEADDYVRDRYVSTGIIKSVEEFHVEHTCLTPSYLKHQVDMSRKKMGLETIDLYYVDNPEMQLKKLSRAEVMDRIKGAFAAMEECVKEGKITAYGMSTINCFCLAPDTPGYLSMEELVAAAKEVGGEDHHFRAIIIPFNASLPEAGYTAVQSVKGKMLPAFHAAHCLGLSSFVGAPLHFSDLCKNLNKEVISWFPELGEQRTNAQCALQYSRTTPGVITTLVGMRTMSHVQENTAIIKYPVTTRSSKKS